MIEFHWKYKKSHRDRSKIRKKSCESHRNYKHTQKRMMWNSFAENEGQMAKIEKNRMVKSLNIQSNMWENVVNHHFHHQFIKKKCVEYQNHTNNRTKIWKLLQIRKKMTEIARNANKSHKF